MNAKLFFILCMFLSSAGGMNLEKPCAPPNTPVYGLDDVEDSPIILPESIVMQHLIVAFDNCVIPDDPILLEEIMRMAAIKARARPLEFIYHRFEPNGISAILVLSESHISLHYWYEHRYAAIDVFTCGDCDPQKAVVYLKERFIPSFVVINRVERPGPNTDSAHH